MSTTPHSPALQPSDHPSAPAPERSLNRRADHPTDRTADRSADPVPARVSLWSHTATLPEPEPLRRDDVADVCVIGGGIAGLSVALQLLEEGRTVVVLEDGDVGGGMTARTSAHLSCVLDDRFARLERLRGPGAARAAAASHAAAIDRIESVVTREGIDCGFRRVAGFLFAGTHGDARALRAGLKREAGAARRAGLDVEELARPPFAGFGPGPCLRVPGQARFHPLLYMAGLARAIEARGGRIRRAHATAVEEGPLVTVRARVPQLSGTDDATAAEEAPTRSVIARHVVVATNSPINNRVALHLKLAAFMTYVIAVRVPRGVVAPGLYWDNEEPYHYIRLEDDPTSPHHELLIVGGEDHRTGDDQHEVAGTSPHARLEEWVRARVPEAGEVTARWGGQVMETIDGLAYIGHNPGSEPNVWVVAGDSGMGLTHGTIAGMLLPDLMAGLPHPWAEAYDPSRRPVRALAAFAPEALHATARYADWVTRGDVENADLIADEQGAVVRRGLHKVAVYRDGNGILHERSAVCPHLGGIVTWNAHEKTWDCPCHGSRFDRWGHVICGPANSGLGTPAHADDATPKPGSGSPPPPPPHAKPQPGTGNAR